MPAKRSSPQAEKSAFAAAYRDGLGLACVAVCCTARGISIEASTQAATADVTARWWCRRDADAARIVSAARTAMRRRESKAKPAAADACSTANDSQAFACTAVADAARRHGVALFSDEEVAAHAAELAARIDAELQKLKESGSLRSVNQAYKTYRLAASGRRERVLRYDEWMRQYRAELVRQAAAALREF